MLVGTSDEFLWRSARHDRDRVLASLRAGPDEGQNEKCSEVRGAFSVFGEVGSGDVEAKVTMFVSGAVSMVA